MLSRTSTTLLEGLHDPQNDGAWRRFYARYAPMLCSYARRIGLSDADVQEVVSDTLTTFVQVYRDGRYDRGKARLKSWLGGIAKKKVLKLRARRRDLSLDALRSANGGRSVHEPAAPDDSAAFELEWQLERLNQALELLRREAEPETYQAFDLYGVKGWPAARVAAFLGVTSNAVYISKTRMTARLREIVDRLAAEEE